MVCLQACDSWMPHAVVGTALTSWARADRGNAPVVLPRGAFLESHNSLEFSPRLSGAAARRSARRQAHTAAPRLWL